MKQVTPKKERPRPSAWALCAFVLIFGHIFGCAGDPSESEQSGDGSANVVAVTQGLSAADVSRVVLTVSGSGISPSIVSNLVKKNGQWTAALTGIPTGSNRTFHGDAYDSGNQLIYSGEATGVTVTTGAPVVVSLLLQQVTAPPAFSNSAPEISALTASASEVAPSAAVSLNLQVTDPDGDAMTYAWSATGGTFSSTSVVNPTWTAPATNGTYTLSVSVSDGHDGTAGLSLSIVVATRGSANASVSFNTWPLVSSVAATPGQLEPSQQTALSVTASDPDGDALSYAWTDDCSGSFSSTSVTNPTWTAPATAPADGVCTLHVAVSDGRGGSNTGSLAVGINLPAAGLPPVVTFTSQTASALLATQQASFDVQASDPQSLTLSFSWSATGGTLGTPSSTSSEATVDWTAPAASGTFTITATVQNSAGQSTTHVFSVDVTGACSDGTQNYGETGVDCGGPCSACFVGPTYWKANTSSPSNLISLSSGCTDGDRSNYGSCNTTLSAGDFIQIDYGSPQGLDYMGVYYSYSGGTNGGEDTGQFVLRGSNDCSSFVDLGPVRLAHAAYGSGYAYAENYSGMSYRCYRFETRSMYVSGFNVGEFSR